MRSPSIAIVGCGLIGQKRALALHNCRLLLYCDPVRERAEELAGRFPGAKVEIDWQA
jgi:predicted dehydrogenase